MGLTKDIPKGSQADTLRDVFITRFIGVIDSKQERLTPWELKFVLSVKDQYNSGSKLTSSQFSTLNEIYQKLRDL